MLTHRHARRRTERAARHEHPVLIAASAGAAGAVLSHFWDPDRGRARRARARDQCTAAVRHARRRLGRAGTRRVRNAEGRLQGLASRARAIAHRSVPDDVTLAQKVRSEVLGSSPFHGWGVHVDAYDGTVHLRGELPSRESIDALVSGVERVQGVRRVESYLHLPGRAAPNKEDALLAGRSEASS